MKQPMKKLCNRTSKQGKPCGAWAARGKKTCFLHTGDNAQKMAFNSNKRRVTPDSFGDLAPFEPPQTVADAKRLLALTVTEIREGRLEYRVGTAVITGCTAFINAVGVADLEAQITKLEGGKK